MKGVLLLALLASLSLVSAQDISFFKEEYAIGETLQGEIFLTIDLTADLKSTQITLLDETGSKVSTQINLIKIEKNHYFFYADLPETIILGEYILLISDISYKDPILKKTSRESAFTVKNPTKEIIRIFPGIITFMQYEKNFKSLRISNIEDKAVTIPLQTTENFFPSINTLTLSAQTFKVFYLHLKPEIVTQTGVILYQISEEYALPVYVFSEPESCIPLWSCTEWSSCITNTQTRLCTDLNNCDITCVTAPAASNAFFIADMEGSSNPSVAKMAIFLVCIEFLSVPAMLSAALLSRLL